MCPEHVFDTSCSWGAVMVGMGFVKNWTQLLALRAVLGIFVSSSKHSQVSPAKQLTPRFCAGSWIVRPLELLCRSLRADITLNSFPACLFLITCAYESR